MIAIVYSAQQWARLDGCVLVDLPDDYRGSRPLQDGQPLAQLQAAHDGPAVDPEHIYTVLDDGETYSSLIGTMIASQRPGAEVDDDALYDVLDDLDTIVSFEPVAKAHGIAAEHPS